MRGAIRSFVCEKCSAVAEAGDGGLCLGCDRLLCARHFPRRAPDREAATRPEYFCEDCQSAGQ